MFLIHGTQHRRMRRMGRRTKAEPEKDGEGERILGRVGRELRMR